MKKRYLILSAICFLFSVSIWGCKKNETESITIPDTIVTEQPVSGNRPEIEPITEETTSDTEETVSETEPEVVYPYWSELHDYNLDQQVLAQDGEFKNLTIQPGNHPDELYITWFSRSSSRGKVTFQSEGLFPDIVANATTEGSISVPGYYRNSALIKGLESNTAYKYYLTNGNRQSPVYSYETGDLYATDFTFTIAGDPEIGLGDVEELPGHRSIWRVVLNRMKSQIPESSFLITTGDQVAKPDSTEHYDYFLDNSVLYSTPLVPLVGNHDVGSGFFGDHFSLPNQSPLGTSQGKDGDYWFVRGNVLFMVINTSTVMEKDIHEQFVAETIAKNQDARWRVVLSHYSPATVVEKYQGQREDVRYTFGYMAENYDIDLFLSGHDHAYTRSYFLDQDCDPRPGQTLTNEFHNPQDPLYIIFGSATNALLRAADNSYPWAAKSVQNGVPQLSKAHVTENSFTITTYDADTWNVIDSFTIYKD